MLQSDIDFFDCNTEWLVVERKLPHWIQAGAVCFVTWRTADSLPQSVLEHLDREIAELLRSHKLDVKGDWKRELRNRDPVTRGRVQWKLFSIRDRFLDAGYGDCFLSQPKCSQVVLDGLCKFDEDRYFLTDIVVMPNHVHFMAAFRDEKSFLKQCTDWKRFMARDINRLVGRGGEFWQVDQFDHLVRSQDQFYHYRRYIADNPLRAKLPADRFGFYQKELIMSESKL